MWYLVVLFVVSPAVHCGNVGREHVVGRSGGFNDIDRDSRVTEKTCQCVPSNFCADDEALVNGQGLLDVRIDKNPCSKKTELCCKNPMDLPESIQVNDLNIKECGFQYHLKNVALRITSSGSKLSEFGELPWTTIVLFRDPTMVQMSMYKCGGSLIHPHVVITAAHCVVDNDVKYLTVRVGEWNTESIDESITHQDIQVQDMVVHPEFHIGSLRNDISLLFLTDSVILTDNIGIICLPPQELELSNSRCIASGWGKNAFKHGKHSSIMKKVVLPLVEREKCIAALRKTRLGRFYRLHKSFICAGGESDSDTCKGDGGSPLVCPIPGVRGRFFQIGIVSWGIGCGEDYTPGVYVNVPLYRKWIDKELTARNLDISVYEY